MPSHPLTNFEIRKYYQNEPKFNGVFSRNNLPKVKDGAQVINLDEFKSIGTHWIVLYVNGNKTIYFDSFGVEHVLKEIKKFIGNKNTINNIYRIQAYDSMMYGYFCIGLSEFIGFIGFIVLNYLLKVCLLEYEKNDKIILKCFQ